MLIYSRLQISSSMKEYEVSLVRKGDQMTFEERKPVRSREQIVGYLEWLEENYPEEYQLMVLASSLVYPEM